MPRLCHASIDWPFARRRTVSPAAAPAHGRSRTMTPLSIRSRTPDQSRQLSVRSMYPEPRPRRSPRRRGGTSCRPGKRGDTRRLDVWPVRDRGIPPGRAVVVDSCRTRALVRREAEAGLGGADDAVGTSCPRVRKSGSRYRAVPKLSIDAGGARRVGTTEATRSRRCASFEARLLADRVQGGDLVVVDRAPFRAAAVDGSSCTTPRSGLRAQLRRRLGAVRAVDAIAR